VLHPGYDWIPGRALLDRNVVLYKNLPETIKLWASTGINGGLPIDY
jgi:hypothetical protein